MLWLRISAINCDNFQLQESNRNSKIFDDRDAVCYTFENIQDPNITVEEINEVIYLEYYALQDAGLLGNNAAGHDQTFDPIPYILKNNTSNLTKNKIEAILEAENEYYKFIGIID